MTKIKCVAVLLCLIILGGSAPYAAAEDAVGGAYMPAYDVFSYDTDDLIQNILAYEMEMAGVDEWQEFADGYLAERAGLDAEWYVIALSQYDATLSFEVYADALEVYLADHRVASASTRQKYALALVACGRENTAFVRDTLNDSIGHLGIMSLVFGLHLLNNSLPSEDYTSDELVDAIAAVQLADGGFAVSGEHADADVTAMALQALAPHAERTEISAVIERAIDCLSGLQADDGGFRSYGVTNAESCAQVLMALCALGIDPDTDARFIKNGYTVVHALECFRTSSGGYGHVEGDEAQISATAQTLCAYVALWRAQNGKNFIYHFDDVRYDPSVVSDKNVVTKEQGAYAKYQLLLSWGLGITALIVAFVLLAIKKKRGWRDALLVIGAAAVLIVLVLVVRVRTPEDYYGVGDETGKEIGTVTLEIRCDTVAGLDDDIPADGVMFAETEMMLCEGDTAYDVLIRAMRQHRLLVVTNGGTMGGNSSLYISGINNLYEFDYGDLSGWMYAVNGVFPSCGCGTYLPQDKDKIVFCYTRDLGEDLGEEVTS